jgi:pimeloyl-[acyl-carrier protein] synthase
MMDALPKQHIVFDPLDPSFVKDPYPVYKALRQHDPVHRSRMGYWVLTRYDDVVNAIRDTRLSNEPSPYAVTNKRNREKYTASDVANNIIPFMDPPKHTSARKMIGKAFHGHLKSAPPDIQGVTDRLLTGFTKKGVIDIINDIGTPLSIAVIAQLLGVPEHDERKLKEWSNWFFYLFSVIPSNEVLNKMNRALGEFRHYILNLVNERKESPRNDLISKLLNVRDGENKLQESELVDTCMLLIADSVENVDRGIGNAIAYILKPPDILAKLKGDPHLIPDAIEESLRINPPGQFIAKIAKENINIRGKIIRKNDAVLLILASANRDPDYFENPDEFNLERSNSQHLAFGKGPHSCIGAPLVRMEMEIILRTLITRLEDLKLKDQEFEWEARLGHRWLKKLPLTFKPY